jgi:nucleotide-binding universal stress UspA family protein
MVPVDFSKNSGKALSHAVKLSRADNARLLIVHVLPTLAYSPEGSFVDYFAAVESAAKARMKRLVGRYKLKPAAYRSAVVTGGDTARTIADLAKKHRVAMIIMGSHGRSGLERFMLGSVAERTLRYAHCPVLIVKG